MPLQLRMLVALLALLSLLAARHLYRHHQAASPATQAKPFAQQGPLPARHESDDSQPL